MARPAKCRIIHSRPAATLFIPQPEVSQTEVSVSDKWLDLSMDEWECLRLLDYQGLSQSQAAGSMQVSRQTIQALSQQARRTVARALVEGLPLRIGGGHYRQASLPPDSHCPFCDSSAASTIWKGGISMKIAVPYENGQIFGHFGRTPAFKFYTADDKTVTHQEVISAPAEGHGALGDFLKEQQVQVLICSGIGGGARNAMKEAGIELYAGASGDADSQVQSFLQGQLPQNSEATCNEHDHEHGCSHQHQHQHQHGHGHGHGAGGHKHS